MRISDWSSDVCSSDLPDLMVLARAAGLSLVLAGGGALAAAAFLRLLGGRRSAALAMLAFAVGMLALRPPYPSADRKRVVEGTSVSVRVGLGGRRIIKKQQ